MESELSNTVTVVGNYNSVPISITFKVLEDADVTTLMNIKEIDKLIKVILNIKNMDKETKDLIIDFLTYNYKNINS